MISVGARSVCVSLPVSCSRSHVRSVTERLRRCAYPTVPSGPLKAVLGRCRSVGAPPPGTCSRRCVNGVSMRSPCQTVGSSVTHHQRFPQPRTRFGQPCSGLSRDRQAMASSSFVGSKPCENRNVERGHPASCLLCPLSEILSAWSGECLPVIVLLACCGSF
jgi:hypothetical protein